MRKILYWVCIGVAVFSLAACSTRAGNPAGVTDANAMGQASDVQTAGIGNGDSAVLGKHRDNMVGDDGGPETGLLGKRSFYFKFNSDAIASKYDEAIEAHAQYLIAHSEAKVLIQGNTDLRGSREYNIALGQRRANAIKQRLLSEGVPKKQVRTISYGAERPVALGHTEADYQMDRRDDIVYESN
ncbi:MAG: OmpA family protein [Gammaproteobacteria bacterium]|nr:OmpA family protein [Gammaproteobacteria bacterium]MBU1558666.1 OmpA family protein [Gammaproteobacteria bacterium]MBU2545670.1 OmpA family protein [Gammaproteobacteria bacterium]